MEKQTDCEGCQRPSRVKLFDGRDVCTYCDDWRCECEARRLLKAPKDLPQELEWRVSKHHRNITKLVRYIEAIRYTLKKKRG